MEIKWLNAVIDLPADGFDTTSAFWAKVTGTTMGDIHPDHPEYIHLNPPSGDMHLELQRLDDGPARAHLDLVVDDIPAMVTHAISCGATLVHQPGHAVLDTPGGVPFCIVPFSGENQKSPSIDPEYVHAVDQICLDVPHDHFEDDVIFWAELTGWDVNPGDSEFRSFDQPAFLPLRILIQRLGADDTGGGRAHLDISSGDHVRALTAVHEAKGATVLEEHKYWTALTDPAGMPYCLTSRPPNLD
jgi:hypothetical protein